MKPPKAELLTKRVEDDLRQRIASGALKLGERLPIEKDLAAEMGVSRTVIREAVAALRSDNLLVARHGVGVFVANAMTSLRQSAASVSTTVLDALEFRMAVETHAAGLAAARRSWAQEEKILNCLESMKNAIEKGEPSEDADFSFHVSVAEATNNPMFVDFLLKLGRSALPRSALVGKDRARLITREYLEKTLVEHRLICSCISRGDVEGSRAAMLTHLGESQARYKGLNFPEELPVI